MLAEKKYAYDTGTEVRKLNENKQYGFKLIKNISQSKAKGSKTKLICMTLAIFSMLMIITYRYNIISEKNYNIQKLSKELETVTSEFATTQIAVDKLVDVNYVESYAKQQLGMQKPDKSQIVYIDMKSENSISKSTSSNFFESGIEKIKTVINNIF